MEELGRAIMFDEDKVFLKLYHHFLSSQGYSIFTTDNPYKLLLYGREIRPDIVFLDAEIPQHNDWEFLKAINNETWMQDVPVVIISNDSPAENTPNGISNICEKQNALEKIIELLETYCQGNQQHDCLILADYNQQIQQEVAELKKHHINCFLAHDIKGSKKYLNKNTPQRIAIKYSPERFANIREAFPKGKTFRIDSLSEITHH